jgi:hypothetical protein
MRNMLPDIKLQQKGHYALAALSQLYPGWAYTSTRNHNSFFQPFG